MTNPDRTLTDAATTRTNPTTDLLRRLAGEPELVLDPEFHRAPLTATVAMHFLDHIADWLDAHQHLEVGR